MFRIAKLRLAFVLLLGLCLAASSRSAAQDSSSNDDPSEIPLGDIARNLRNSSPAPKEVIDNDNLDQVMNQAETRHSSVLRFLMAGDDKNLRVAAPDVTCSLSFTASTKALLADQYAQMNLPPSEVSKLTGPATIEGDALTVSLFNGTDWHVSEIDVAFTLVKKNVPDTVTADGMAPTEGFPPPLQVPQHDLESDLVRPEKKSDQTVIYKMRTAAPPLTASTFSAPLNLDVASGQEWHWAIVEAKGYPPQNRQATSDKTSSASAQIVGDTTNPSQENAPLDPSPAGLSNPQ